MPLCYWQAGIERNLRQFNASPMPCRCPIPIVNAFSSPVACMQTIRSVFLLANLRMAMPA